ncbi:MAG: class I SAM-dependent methyltransferase [Rhodothermia bacterium]|nr:class I SAM-dependent methyltransferase [Rhodothermia bacterium]
MISSINNSAGGVAPYVALASVYDLVMDHVDYQEWAEYIHGLVHDYAGEPADVLELGCGTGSFAFEFADMIDCRYRATDGSASMVRVAREKSALYGSAIDIDVLDFTAVDPLSKPGYDLVLLLYDGINYLTTPADVESALRGIRSLIRPEGHLILDQSTPANSVNNADFFEDKGTEGLASYIRRSRYDAVTGLHHTTFDLLIDGEAYHEHHVQRAYSLNEMSLCLSNSGFEIVAAFEDFTRTPANEQSERVQWVVRPA